MKLLKTKTLNYLINPFKNLLTILFFMAPFIGLAQEKLDIQDSQVEPPQASAALEQGSAKEAFKKIKLDGIAGVVGDYVILESLSTLHEFDNLK